VSYMQLNMTFFNLDTALFIGSYLSEVYLNSSKSLNLIDSNLSSKYVNFVSVKKSLSITSYEKS